MSFITNLFVFQLFKQIIIAEAKRDDLRTIGNYRKK